MNWQAKWIKPVRPMGDVASVFERDFDINKIIKDAKLIITALGIYEAKLNGKRISDYVLAPGWTAYKKRLQYQEYDITEAIQEKNRLSVTVGKGWYRSPMSGDEKILRELQERPCGLIAQIELTYEDGQKKIIGTDDTWTVSESEIRFSEIYDGEVCDARFKPERQESVEVFDGPSETLIPQEGEKVIEQERLTTASIITTPKGERVIDFGQEITGYVEITVDAKSGEEIKLSHGEVLDEIGNFYNANYRSAKAELCYTCTEGVQTYHPRLTFYGFRYVRIDKFPGGVDNAKPENFVAIAVYSDIKRTGYVDSSNPLLNKFFDNVIWGQKDNFLDIPTDCPQRDERLGWTGDVQAFIRAAAYNYDVERFFEKWLNCLKAEQLEDGYVGHMVPDTWQLDWGSCAWGDVATICPWEVYRAYGNERVLKNQFESMKKWLGYIANHTKEKDLWIGWNHFGDWLGLDAREGERTGGSDKDLLASAYYAYSTENVIKTGKIIGEDVTEYEELYERIVKAFQNKFTTYKTQTECVIAVHFRVAKDCQAVADQLAQMIKDVGMKIQTGFVGTPYLMHVLSDYGHTDIAYSLLLREEYPSWLYQVRKGATTTWEHWDGIKEDGSFWDTNMNSFNHYAYGAVIDWVYGVACGIKAAEPGYSKVRIAPHPDQRLDWMKATLNTRNGIVHSEWKKQDGGWRYEITTPVNAQIVIAEKEYNVSKGTYYFFEKNT